MNRKLRFSGLPARLSQGLFLANKKNRATLFGISPLVLILSCVCLACQAPLHLKEAEIRNLDYYFGPSYLQIQGHAKLPGVVSSRKEKAKTQEASFGPSLIPKKQAPAFPLLGGVDQNRYLTYSERRKICKKRALLNAHSKWLSLTEDKWLPQHEWVLRLRLGEKSPWNHCLEKAKIMSIHYDRPNGCRLVVRYFCDPRDY